ncbi:hypothetical protein AAFC00_001322 [Neodothiora populina]|uniref:Velvet domain-containing protein n=1 Tax=Neodothiora populina TaxID=2781224 RepID=A0ABR3PNI2_9PEZI
MERIISVPNETHAQTSRIARDGRKITYKLKVLQQPERARACGSGAKSSADRRPVDPPPIVELRIYEGANEEKDVTFQLSANYFLFATLEQARPIAQGRVPQDPSRATVLTGTPVAGMVYLDRPEPAGYFIFPDLSVRHEGKYRLGFSLYEELKDIKDADRVDENDSKAQGLGEAHVTHRLEVRSQPFTVYSAKRFPGLASSTSLSRTVAEQGCRVRIRRDVRMRRREKPGKDGYDGYSDGGYERARHSATPDMYQQHLQASQGIVNQRERTASISSHHSIVAAPDVRRTSLQDMAQSQAYAPSAAYGAPAPSALQNSQAAAAMSQPSQYGGPVAQQYAPQYSYQQAPMPPPQMSYSGYQYASTAAPVHQQQQQQQHQQQTYQYSQPPHVTSMSQYDSHSHARNPSSDYGSTIGTDSRRSSGVVAPPTYSYGQQAQGMHAQYPPHSGSYSMPSTTREPVQHATTAIHSGAPMTSQILPPINTTMQPRDKIEAATATSGISPTHPYYGKGLGQTAPDAGAHAGSKRGYDRVFSTTHMHEPLRQGARPSSPYVHQNGHSMDQSHDDGIVKMMYRRADGREIARPLPPSI